MTTVLEKVTAFVVRTVEQQPHLLLFEHPTAGIQIPAGTVEAGELPAVAALREAQEETGLTDLTIKRYLGAADDPLPAGHKVLAATTPVHARPAADSPADAHLRRGLPVAVLRTANGFTQVTYQAYDRVPDGQMISMSITGWVADSMLADSRLRHFFILTFSGQSAERWQVYTDQHWFTLFWAPLDRLPLLISPQDTWLRFLEGTLL